MNDMTVTVDDGGEQIRADMAPIVERATALVVRTPDDYTSASEYLKVVKGAQKRVGDFFGPMKTKAHDAWKSIVATEAEALKPLTAAEALLKSTLTTYLVAEEKNRADEQRKLQAAADEQARKDRERLEKAAARLKTPELRVARLEQAAAVIAPVVAVAVPVMAQGQSVRKTFVAIVTDAAKVPREWMMVNDAALQAFARSTKGAAQVAGVRFEEKVTLASSSR